MLQQELASLVVNYTSEKNKDMNTFKEKQIRFVVYQMFGVEKGESDESSLNVQISATDK